MHDGDILVDDLTCISDIKEQMEEIKTEWFNERISPEEYEKRLDFIRVILLYLMAHSRHITSDDIEFLEASTPSNALVMRSLQKQLDMLKKKMLA